MNDLEKEIPRYEAPNPFKYTKVQLATRKRALLDMKKDYPSLPDGWLEMVYDFYVYTGEEEVARIMESGEWEKPGKFSGKLGGILKNMEVLDPEEADSPDANE